MIEYILEVIAEMTIAQFVFSCLALICATFVICSFLRIFGGHRRDK